MQQIAPHSAASHPASWSLLASARLLGTRSPRLSFIQCLPEKSLDDRLPAYIETRGPRIELTQHAHSQIYIDPAYGPDQGKFVGEVGGHILPARRLLRDFIG